MFYPHYTLQLHEPAHHERDLRGLKDHQALHQHYKDPHGKYDLQRNHKRHVL